jgi:hypothetical protein
MCQLCTCSGARAGEAQRLWRPESLTGFSVDTDV